jgi:hypothetical protein
VLGATVWLVLLVPVTGLAWLRHIANPSDDVDWLPLYWPVLLTVLMLAIPASVATTARKSGRRSHG